jgi:CheY-like chemotaxis protein
MGTGLGLSVVKFSAEAMNGRVSVESILGEGSEFIVTIPVRHDKAVSEVEGEQDQSDAVYVPEPDGVQTADALSQDQDVPRILIVEDTPEVARWEMRQLDSSYAFYFASDGAEGLRKAEEIVPDLIISDVMMPVMDGVEMCRHIRESELLCHIPVIMVTAKVDHEDRLKGLEAGADAYLEKPYDETELDLRVRKLLQQRILLKNMFSERFESADVSSVTEDPGYSAADRAFLEKFDELLEDAFVSGKVACEDLASAMCIGRTQLNRKIKAITGYKTSEYILMARLAKAKKLLSTTSMPVGEVALSCGIEDVSYFSTLFRKHTGLTPSAFRNS